MVLIIPEVWNGVVKWWKITVGFSSKWTNAIRSVNYPLAFYDLFYWTLFVEKIIVEYWYFIEVSSSRPWFDLEREKPAIFREFPAANQRLHAHIMWFSYRIYSFKLNRLVFSLMFFHLFMYDDNNIYNVNMGLRNFMNKPLLSVLYSRASASLVYVYYRVSTNLVSYICTWNVITYNDISFIESS